MRRFFFPPQTLDGDQIVLTGPEARHMATVLRLKPGQIVELFDGQGAVHAALLATVDRNRITARITATRRETATTGSPLTLAQCLLKGKKMDFLVQKATELGVHAFMPVISKYCENHGDRDHQAERWQRIMLEACKQCHRATPMTILPVTPLDRLDGASYRYRLAAWEEERQIALPTDFVLQKGSICLLLGPEGGFHPDDLHTLQQGQFATFSLGPRILRGETAALAAVAIVQYLTGGLQPPNVQEAE